jgi:hypothetical protein
MSLKRDNGIQILPLLSLSLDSGKKLTNVGDIVLGLGPGLTRKNLLLEGELSGAAETENTVVRLLGRQALEGGLDIFVLLGDQVVIATLH